MAHFGSKSFRLVIYTLGDFDVFRDNKSLISTRGKIQKTPLSLLKVLIAHGGRAVSNSILMDALWPESEDPTSALSVNVCRLRKLLAVENVLYQKDHKTLLNTENCLVDAIEFRENFRALARKGCSQQRETLLELYRGKFLPGDAEQSWSLRMRENLHDMFTSLLISYAQQLEEEQRWQDAAHWYDYGLGHDDLYAPFYHGRMRCYVETDRVEEALETYYRCERMLGAELSRKPGLAMQGLYKRIIACQE